MIKVDIIHAMTAGSNCTTLALRSYDLANSIALGLIGRTGIWSLKVYGADGEYWRWEKCRH
jgi:hypothetical protein